MTYILAFVLSVVGGWFLAASDALFRAEDRPGMFGGQFGTLVLLVFLAAGGLLIAGGAVWIVRAIPSSVVLVIMAGGGYLGATASNRVHVNAAGAANRMLSGLAALVLLYGIAWTVYPPP